MISDGLLARRAAFPEEDRLKLIDAVERAELVAPHKIAPIVPRDFKKFVMEAIAKKGIKSIASAEAVTKALGACDVIPRESTPANPWSKLGRWFRRSQ